MSIEIFDVCREHFKKLDAECVWVHESAVEIEELAKDGKGKIVFEVSAKCLAFQAVDDQPPIRWLKEKKCADGAFIVFDDDAVHLHIVELKSRLRLKDWERARFQFRGMLLNSLAIAGLIDLHKFDSITCYLAYTKDLLSPALPTSPVLMKFQLGTGKPLSDIADWIGGTVEISAGCPVPLIKIPRDGNGNASFRL